jgi:hypothetical protein
MKNMPHQLFGRVDVVVGAVVVVGALVMFLVGIPDLARYLRMKSM